MSLHLYTKLLVLIELFVLRYSTFEGGTSQPQSYSRQAQGIISERFELFYIDYMEAQPDFRFLVRLHVWYEVVANISRPDVNLRDPGSGQHTLSKLIKVIKAWDKQEEQDVGTSGVYPRYAMSGLLGVPTFFIELLHHISQLAEEKHSLAQPVQARSDAQERIQSFHGEIQELEVRIQQARPGKLILPPLVEHERQLHKAVSIRFFDLFRLACSVHLLVELRDMPSDAPAIQARVKEMVSLLGNIEQSKHHLGPSSLRGLN